MLHEHTPGKKLANSEWLLHVDEESENIQVPNVRVSGMRQRWALILIL